MSEDKTPQGTFAELDLIEPLQQTIRDIGYEVPSPIQSLTIPHLLKRRDIVGQAQTGTGKTAAFALPILSQIDLNKHSPQVLVLAPTRELANQVAEAFKKYGARLKGLNVLAVYGGQDYGIQLRPLRKGVHVVVGTPGRVMDHLRRGTLKLTNLRTMVLDEADEMLRMGFIDSVEWILEQTPADRHTALFSATMPAPIRRIAQKYLNNPKEISIKIRTEVAATITQRYCVMGGYEKIDALQRILQVEQYDGVIVFTKTKTATVEVAEKLTKAGLKCSPLNGDIAQNLRERTVTRLKNGEIDIIVATDVAARGLDVKRISHVINYDTPFDPETYVHRVGRTGRAGKTGQAILFLTPREKNMVRIIERTTKQKIALMELPSNKVINQKRIAAFKQKITDTLDSEEIGFFTELLEQYREEAIVSPMQMAAALAILAQGGTSLRVKGEIARKNKKFEKPSTSTEFKRKDSRIKPESRVSADSRRTSEPRINAPSHAEPPVRSKPATRPDKGMERYRIEVGSIDSVKPGNIVGAIANEADLDSEHIGRIDIFDDHSTVDLPAGMPEEIFLTLKNAWVCSKQLRISKFDAPHIVTKKKHVHTHKKTSSFAKPAKKRKSRGVLRLDKRDGAPGKKQGKKVIKQPAR
ncbi:MAG: DEAD/DEAH box helicase [Desulfobulbaceae bacterium]|jgi:ATP-dependent RNA helicase DeaD|nr:DEAD/DEAH box helicase [Desulfobulbaceae bacterium]